MDTDLGSEYLPWNNKEGGDDEAVGFDGRDVGSSGVGQVSMGDK